MPVCPYSRLGLDCRLDPSLVSFRISVLRAVALLLADTTVKKSLRLFTFRPFSKELIALPFQVMVPQR